MINYPRVVCLTLLVTALLVGCGGTPATPAVVDTMVSPSEPPTSPPPSATPAPPTPTSQPPTETQPPPTSTLAPPIEQPTATVVPDTPASSPVTPQAELPVEGVWTGGGTDLLLDFEIHSSSGQANLSHVGIVWVGRGECELNVRLDVSVPVNEGSFVMNYHTDEFSVVMKGSQETSSLMTGTVEIQVEGCGDHEINWRAMPKPGASQ